MEETTSENKKINLLVEGESFWGLQLTENTAIVNNLVLSGVVQYMDKVRFNPENMMVEEVLESTYDTIAIIYKTTEETVEEDYAKLHEYLKEKDMHLEGMGLGIALLAFPKQMTDEQIIEIMENTPIQTAPYGEVAEDETHE